MSERIYGFTRPDGVDDVTGGTGGTSVIIVVSDLMKTYVEGMVTAVQLGRQLREFQQSINPPIVPSMQGEFWGVFDNLAYGVYDSMEKLQVALCYWNREMMGVQSFGSYNEALAYARKGVADCTGIPESNIPKMKYAVNWREKVFVPSTVPIHINCN